MPIPSSSSSRPGKREDAEVVRSPKARSPGGSVRTWAREGLSYTLVGLVQICVDWLCFVVLTYFGMATIGANIIGRVGGAMLGFWLNGRFTFSASGARLDRGALLRFALSWGTMTAISTLAVNWTDQGQGLHVAWLAKPLIDAALAAAGFLISKCWIYR